MKTWRDEVSGLSRERIAERFKGVQGVPSAPWPMKPKYCKEWLWWWRDLPKLLPVICGIRWALEPLPLSPQKFHWLAKCNVGLLRALYLDGGMEEWLRAAEDHEWRARLKSSTSSPRPGTCATLGDFPPFKEFTGDGFSCCSAESWEEISGRFRLFLEKQGYTGRKQSVYWQSPRNSRASGAKSGGWLEIFTAVEAVDRATLLHEDLTDSQRRAITARLRGENREN